jgi:hypothetical protein
MEGSNHVLSDRLRLTAWSYAQRAFAFELHGVMADYEYRLGNRPAGFLAKTRGQAPQTFIIHRAKTKALRQLFRLPARKHSRSFRPLFLLAR